MFTLLHLHVSDLENCFRYNISLLLSASWNKKITQYLVLSSQIGDCKKWEQSNSAKCQEPWPRTSIHIDLDCTLTSLDNHFTEGRCLIIMCISRNRNVFGTSTSLPRYISFQNQIVVFYWHSYLSIKISTKWYTKHTAIDISLTYLPLYVNTFDKYVCVEKNLL